MAVGQAASTWEMTSAPAVESNPGSREIAVSVQNVGKMYYLYDRPQDRLKQALLWRFGKNYGRQFWALRDVSFEVRQGEALGIIGRNGSGKSTLLQIIAGIIPPTTGEVSVHGRVTSLLELGSGFNPEFTGRENVYLNGAILGFRRPEMDARFDEIADFAEIGEFIDQPVKFYSSGMFVRLAFAVQACLEPEVLIVDEALSVGDIFFQQKCHARMERLLARDTAILLVSHSMQAIAKYSTRAMLLDQGQCLFLGRPDEAIERYFQIQDRLSRPRILSTPSSDKSRSGADRPSVSSSLPDWPSKEAFLDLSKAVSIGEEDMARCTGVAFCNTQGQPCATFTIGDAICVYYEFEILRNIEVPLGGLTIWNAMNVLVHGRNSWHYQKKMPLSMQSGSRIRFRQTVELTIAPGEYTVTVGMATMSLRDYVRLIEAEASDYPASQILTLVRVNRAGKFLVQPKVQGLSTQFQGYADLKGDITWGIL